MTTAIPPSLKEASSLPNQRSSVSSRMPSLQFSSTTAQALSATLSFLGISAISHCVSRRIATEDFSSLNSWRQLKWTRLCIILVFVDSWLFLVASAVITFGVGLEMNITICASAIYLCIAFYATSKLLIHLFLVEKVRIVWSPSGSQSPRFKSAVFVIGIVAVAAYGVVFGLMVADLIYFLREDGSCVIGLKHFVSISLLVYDFFINVLLTSLFIYPLATNNLRNPRVTRVAVRTLVASGVSLASSTVNMGIVTVLNGSEPGSVCLGAGCGIDVIVNALALFWATSGFDTKAIPSRTGDRQISAKEHRTRRMTLDVSPADSSLNNKDNFELTSTPSRTQLSPVSSSKAPVKNVRGTHGETTLAEPEVLHELEPSQGSDRPQARLSNFFKSGRPLPEVPKKVQITMTIQHDSNGLEEG